MSRPSSRLLPPSTLPSSTRPRSGCEPCPCRPSACWRRCERKPSAFEEVPRVGPGRGTAPDGTDFRCCCRHDHGNGLRQARVRHYSVEGSPVGPPCSAVARGSGAPIAERDKPPETLPSRCRRADSLSTTTASRFARSVWDVDTPTEPAAPRAHPGGRLHRPSTGRCRGSPLPSIWPGYARRALLRALGLAPRPGLGTC